jgi:hypothetical protein
MVVKLSVCLVKPDVGRSAFHCSAVAQTIIRVGGIRAQFTLGAIWWAVKPTAETTGRYTAEIVYTG